MAMKGSTKIKRKAPKRNEDSRRRNGDSSEKFDVEGLGLQGHPTTLCLVRQLRSHITAMEAELECTKAKKEIAERKTQEAEKCATRRSCELKDDQQSEDQARKEKATARAKLEHEQKAHVRFRRDLDHLKSVKDLSVEAMENATRQTERVVSELESLKQRLEWTSEMMQELKGERDLAERERLGVVHAKNKLAKERKTLRSETSCLLASKNLLERETWEARRDRYKAIKDRNDAIKQCREMRSELTELERKRKEILKLTSLYQDRVLAMYPDEYSSTDKQSRGSSLSCVAKKTTNVKLPKIYGNYTLSKTNVLGSRDDFCVLNNTRKVPLEKDCSQDGVILPKVNNITLQNKARK
ncbi:Hypp8563 [Branchiostoma lanceolatum]|uniref:Hypp8563 protein n=1 Tax=Branchiostoma lanceolatum TaxID=7740 RepID=A0A8J9Z9H3_BRALA|nr:Hypp8563 [Branchiostoma lanceolatum]